MGERPVSQAASDAEVYRGCAPALVHFATVLVGADDAPDVVSSAVLSALQSRSWPSVANPRGYLHQAVANEARNHHRGEMRRREREKRAAGQPVVHAAEPHPEVAAAVRQLSVRQRAVVFLAYWEDMTDRMIGECLGISAGSARRHLARARRHLRGVLDGQQ